MLIELWKEVFILLWSCFRGSVLPMNTLVLAVQEDWPGGAGNGEVLFMKHLLILLMIIFQLSAPFMRT